MTKDEALKKARELVQRFVDCDGISSSDYLDVRDAIDKALAQPEQEPVGEAYLCDLCHTPFDGAFQCPSCGHNEATKEPVYTTPPQRTWVGLTDEDYQVLREGVVKQGKPLHWMIEHIEAKLKEKNQ